MTAPGPAPPPRRAALAFIFVTLAIDVLALGITIPVLPKLIEQFTGGDTARAAQIFGVYGTAFALMQFLFAPVLGMLSDRWGRRPVILLSCFGLGLDYIMMAWAPALGWLFAGRAMSGITSATVPAVMAYVADVTPPDRRAASFGVVGAAWGLGFVVGPALGGLLGQVDLRLPFWFAAGLAFANTAWGLFVLPESLRAEHRSPRLAWSRANPVGALAFLRSRPGLVGLASANFLYYLAHHSLPAVFVLYTGYRYGWDERTVGLTLAVVGICNVTVQGVLVKTIVTRFGERRSLLAGLAFGAAGFAIYGLAPVQGIFWCGVPVFAFMGLFSPALQSRMTRMVNPAEQGRLAGANSTLMGVTGLIGPWMFTGVFAHFIGGEAPHIPGAPYLLAALLLVAALAVARRATR
jgi:DHA1 family tetracycline resistance protein-like MFS transporter